jgi:hypothetical protein
MMDSPAKACHKYKSHTSLIPNKQKTKMKITLFIIHTVGQYAGHSVGSSARALNFIPEENPSRKLFGMELVEDLGT